MKRKTVPTALDEATFYAARAMMSLRTCALFLGKLEGVDAHAIADAEQARAELEHACRLFRDSLERLGSP